MTTQDEDDDERYGIDEAHAHPRALEIIPDPFFWDCADELAPFGSDEGDTALAEFRDWRAENPEAPVVDCVTWTIEAVGEMEADEYTDALLDETTLREQIEDDDYDDQQFVYTLDVSIIATVFGQLADEGTIDAAAKPYAARALKRQKLWAKVHDDWEHADEYVGNLTRLEKALADA